MNRLTHSVIAVFAFALFASGLARIAPTSANASLGNTGIPVKCLNTSLILGRPGDFVILQCVATDGTAFANDRVPTGSYLLITDIVVAPDDTSPDPNARVTSLKIAILDPNALDFLDTIYLRSSANDTYGQHFITPFLVLKEGQQLVAIIPLDTVGYVNVRVSGLLVTNLNYLPLVHSN